MFSFVVITLLSLQAVDKSQWQEDIEEWLLPAIKQRDVAVGIVSNISAKSEYSSGNPGVIAAMGATGYLHGGGILLPGNTSGNRYFSIKSYFSRSKQ